MVVHLTGLSPLAPGGYAEQVLVEASMTFPVPNGLPLDIAALTEPMTVACTRCAAVRSKARYRCRHRLRADRQR